MPAVNVSSANISGSWPRHWSFFVHDWASTRPILFYKSKSSVGDATQNVSLALWPIRNDIHLPWARLEGVFATTTPSHPIKLSEWAMCACMTLTVTMHALYKLKTSKVFEESRCRHRSQDAPVPVGSPPPLAPLSSSQPPQPPSSSTAEDPVDCPFAVRHLFMCVDSRLLCVAGQTHVIAYSFSKQETQLECPVCTCMYNGLLIPTQCKVNLLHVK